MVKAVTQGFWVTFYREVCAKFVIPNSPQSPVIGQNSDGRIFDFHISGQSLINKNCRNARTSHGVDMNQMDSGQMFLQRMTNISSLF